MNPLLDPDGLDGILPLPTKAGSSSSGDDLQSTASPKASSPPDKTEEETKDEPKTVRRVQPEKTLDMPDGVDDLAPTKIKAVRRKRGGRFAIAGGVVLLAIILFIVGRKLKLEKTTSQEDFRPIAKTDTADLFPPPVAPPVAPSVAQPPAAQPPAAQPVARSGVSDTDPSLSRTGQEGSAPAERQSGREPQTKSEILPRFEESFPTQFSLNSLKPGKISSDLVVNLVAKLKECPGKIEIVGHTCSLGSDAYNLWVGEQRAKSVLAILVQSGVDAARLKIRSEGKNMPVADNDTEANRQKNRRVTVVCWP